MMRLILAATIILVRHAERAGDMGTDPPLTAQGIQRSESLARLLADAHIQTIFATNTKRTQQTAAPIAEKLHLTPVVLPGQDVPALLERLRSLKPDDVVLVVGHSNTVPQIVSGLGGETKPIPDTEFNRLLIFTTNPTGKPNVVTLRYGE
jgi:broad specificity phosphatase PhoE